MPEYDHLSQRVYYHYMNACRLWGKMLLMPTAKQHDKLIKRVTLWNPFQQQEWRRKKILCVSSLLFSPSSSPFVPCFLVREPFFLFATALKYILKRLYEHVWCCVRVKSILFSPNYFFIRSLYCVRSIRRIWKWKRSHLCLLIGQRYCLCLDIHGDVIQYWLVLWLESCNFTCIILFDVCVVYCMPSVHWGECSWRFDKEGSDFSFSFASYSCTRRTEKTRESL